jgi:homoserine dehydrogenase
MEKLDVIPIGILGLGNVGTGVVRILETHGQDIERRLGARMQVKRVLVRSPDKRRETSLSPEIFTSRVEDILEDPEIRIVVEVMGGTDPARAYVLRALEAGKHVVTANKTLLAEHGREIFALASEKGLDVHYEAAVAGGIPIIRTLREALASDRIEAIAGIVNGTTNFILTEMASGGRAFDEVLREAQEKGYAEADPTADVDGHDAAQKLCLLAALCFGVRVRPEEVHVEGIRNIEPEDLAYAESFGYTIKLLAIGRRHADDEVELRVHPTLVPSDTMLANVSGAFNAVLVTSDALGPSLFHGQGAGSMPTGSAVVADLIDCGRNIMLGTSGRVPHLATRDAYIRDVTRRPIEAIRCGYYLRFVVRDEPGVLGRIASFLGDHGIGISAVVQRERSDVDQGPVSVVIMTHDAIERDVRAALRAIDELPYTARPTRLIRIETEPPVIA